MHPRLAPLSAGPEAENPVHVVVGAELILFVNSAYSTHVTRTLVTAALLVLRSWRTGVDSSLTIFFIVAALVFLFFLWLIILRWLRPAISSSTCPPLGDPAGRPCGEFIIAQI